MMGTHRIGSAVLLAMALAPMPIAAEVDAARQAELLHLLRHDCGSCHGMTLAGGLGPPLLPEALAGKPPEMLTATVLYGRPQHAMPPWRGILNEAEAKWLVHRIVEGVSDAPH